MKKYNLNKIKIYLGIRKKIRYYYVRGRKCPLFYTTHIYSNNTVCTSFFLAAVCFLINFITGINFYIINKIKPKFSNAKKFH